MNKQTIQKLESFLPKVRAICDHNVKGEPLGTTCACEAMSDIVKRLKKEYIA